MAHFISNKQPTSLVDVSAGARVEIQLWGDGPNGEPLQVSSTNPEIAQIEEIQASTAPNLRSFYLRGIRQGSARLHARIGTGGPVWADTRVIVGQDSYNRYYHGTSSDIANLLIGVDLTPMFLLTLVTRFDWTDYTDFGKGFYVHLEENKAMAYQWAKRRFAKDWSVVEFIATPDELEDLKQTALLFRNKKSRPHNSPKPVTVTTKTVSVSVCPVPQLLPCIPMGSVSYSKSTTSRDTMSWLEFVEFNRHITKGGALIARPNDRDWTSQYSSIRGPIWVPRDSGYDTGGPLFPDDIHQLNWGQAGMTMLNAADAKLRRFKFSEQNAGLFPPPA